MLPILQLGPLAIQLPGLLLLAGIWLATNLIEREAPRRKLSPERLNNMILIGLAAGILGARLAYAARFVSIYAENPLSLFSLNPATLAPTEGALIGLLAALIYGSRKKLPLWSTLDVFAPALALFAIALGFAHLASGDAFGQVTTLPWGIELWGAVRHPAQIYEIILAGLVFWVIWRLRKMKNFPGFLFLSWLGLAAATRLLLEGFRGDSLVILGSLRGAQVVALLVTLGAMLGLMFLRRAIPDKGRAGR
jgi:phosphatidylglycerol---prolipoprotein diacylglyceryl transferase